MGTETPGRRHGVCATTRGPRGPRAGRALGTRDEHRFGLVARALTVTQMDRGAAADLLARLHQEQGRLYAGEDQTAVRALLTDDIAWHVPGTSPIAGDYHGIDEVLGYFTHRRDLVQHTMRMHPRELLVGDDAHVAALTDGTATISGVEHSWSTIGLYRIDQDRIAECWLLPLDPAAFDRIWTSVK